MIINTRISQKPLSINAAHYRNKKMTVAYKNYRTAWEIHFKNQGYKKLKDSKGKKYSIFFKFGFSNRASDVDNPIKPALDTMQNLLDFNDKQVYLLSAAKEIVDKGEEYVHVTMLEQKEDQ